MDEEKKSSFLKGCVFENGLYSIEYITYTDKEIAEGILFVDSEPIAEIEFVKKQDNRYEYRFLFQTPAGGRVRSYPFLMLIDSIRMNLFIRFEDDEEMNLQSERILVTTKNDTDRENLKDMIYYIASDKGLYREINSESSESALIVSSINNYFDRVFMAVQKYKPYFFPQNSSAGFSASKTTRQGRVSFLTKRENMEPGSDEERVQLIKFLNMLHDDALSILKEFEDILFKNTKRFRDLKKNIPPGFSAPVITTQELRIKKGFKEFNRLRRSISKLRRLLEVMGSFNRRVKKDSFRPKKNFKIKEVNNLIFMWQKSRNMSLSYQKFFYNIESLDKLYEYYCLARLLNFIDVNEYLPDREKDINYNYKTENELFENEEFLYNTFYRKKNDLKLTLYFQPVIYGNHYENEIGLLRTSGYDGMYTPFNKTGNYYSPDFVLKISGVKDAYLILDSKFQTRNTILKGHMEEVISKYFIQIRDEKFERGQYVYILQGRTDDTLNMLWNYENKEAIKEKDISTFGIIQFSPDVKMNIYFDDILAKLESIARGE